MSAATNLAVVLLAAGKSERFGENKLLAGFKDRPMVCYPMKAMASVGAAHAAVVTGYERVAQLARAHGFAVINNQQPELGQSHSIHLGVRWAIERGADALLFLVGDQPLLSADSLVRLMQAFVRSGKGISCLRDDTHMGNPAVFAKAYFPELLALDGDRGAKGLLQAHGDDLIIVDCTGKGELADCDTAQALREIEKNK